LCAHFSGGWHPVASHFIAEHYVFAGDVETASYYGWMNTFLFNVGYHSEHHDFPLVAWSNLPKLSTIGKYKETLPHHDSWIYALCEFIFNPKIKLYNRIKRKPKGEDEIKAYKSLSADIGHDADYNEKEWFS